MYRQLLSYPIPSPHHPLSTSSLAEPSWSAIVKSPVSPEGTSNLIQLARMVLCLAVWAPGNEKVITKIQALGEAHMAELMKGIEEVMASMPPEDEVEDGDEDDADEGSSGRGIIPTPAPSRGAALGPSTGMSRRPTSMSLSSSVLGSAEERRRSLGSSRRSSPDKKSIAR
jgi:protein HOOK3